MRASERMSRIIGLEVARRPLPDVALARRLGRDEPGSRLFRGLRVLRTDAGDGLEGHGLTFTIGRGTEVVVAGVHALEPLVVGPLRRGSSRRTRAGSGATSSATASCAGSGPRRA